MSAPLPRRAVLRVAGTGVPAGLLLALAGCTEEAPSPPPDPDRAAMENALAVEERLRDVVAALPPDPQRAAEAVGVVGVHLEVLRTALGESTPSPSASPSTTPPADLVDLLEAADAAVDSHTAALRQASPAISPLLASLAASDAALAALVRGTR